MIGIRGNFTLVQNVVAYPVFQFCIENVISLLEATNRNDENIN